jgi:hypothetical protein
MPWIAAAVVGSAAIGAYSANKATEAQTDAAQQGLALQQQIYSQTRSDLSPWTLTGMNALYQLSDALGVARPIASSGGAPGQPSGPTPGMQAAMGYSGGGSSGSTLGDVNSFARNPAGILNKNSPVNTFFKSVFGEDNRSAIGDIQAALQAGQTVSDASWAEAGYGPGGAALGGGQTNLGLVQSPVAGWAGSPAVAGSGGTPGMTQGTTFQGSPGYQFAFDQGTRAVNASAGTQGLLGSGSRLKALTQFGQGIANQEFWNYLNQLGNLSTQGQNAASQTGQFGQNYANAASGLYGAQGNAQAANAVAQGNIWGDAVGNLAPLFGGGGGFATPDASGGWTPGPQGFPNYGYGSIDESGAYGGGGGLGNIFRLQW